MKSQEFDDAQEPYRVEDTLIPDDPKEKLIYETLIEKFPD